MKAYYEIILYKNGQLFDFFDRTDSFTNALAIAERKSLEDEFDCVAIAKEVYEDDDMEDRQRAWTKTFKNGKCIGETRY